MNGDFPSLLAILTAFSLYGVLSGVELGVALLRVEPRLAPAKPSRKVFTPRLEATNVLLAVGCLGLAVLFNEAAVSVVSEMWPIIALGLAALLLRAGFLVYLYSKKVHTGGKSANYVFLAASLVVPLALGACGIFMVTGDAFWQTGVGATLFLSLVLGLLALGAAFLFYLGGSQTPQGVVAISRMLNMALAGVLAIVLLGVLNGGGSHLFNLPYAYLAVIAAGLVLVQAALMAAGKEWRMWWFLASLALIAPFLLGLANYPYLVFPTITL